MRVESTSYRAVPWDTDQSDRSAPIARHAIAYPRGLPTRRLAMTSNPTASSAKMLPRLKVRIVEIAKIAVREYVNRTATLGAIPLPRNCGPHGLPLLVPFQLLVAHPGDPIPRKIIVPVDVKSSVSRNKWPEHQWVVSNVLSDYNTGINGRAYQYKRTKPANKFICVARCQQ